MGLRIGGARSATGVSENDINLKIAFKTKEILEANGIKVILTRTDENGIQDSSCTTIRQKKNSDLNNRIKIGNNSNASLFISIHLNHIGGEQYWGWQTFYKKADNNGKKIAELIQNNLSKNIERENKRQALSIGNKYIVDKMKIPVCIVECGFLSNREEEKLLQQDEYQQKLAQGISDGIIEYFR